MRTGEEDAWKTVREKIMELEEGGTWREKGKETSMMTVTLQNFEETHRDGVEVRDGVSNDSVKDGVKNDGVRSEAVNGMKDGDVIETGDENDEDEIEIVRSHDGVGGVRNVAEDVREVGAEHDGACDEVGNEDEVKNVIEVENGMMNGMSRRLGLSMMRMR